MAEKTTDRYGVAQQGTSAQRPTNAWDGATFYDLTLRELLIWDAASKNWFSAAGRAVYSASSPRMLSDDFKGPALDGRYAAAKGSDGAARLAALGSAIAAATAAGLITLTDSTGLSASHDDTLAALTNSNAGYVYYQNIVAASTSAGADQLDVSAGGGAMANIVQPDVPRNVVINFTDGDASISAFQVDVVGVAPDGSAVTEQFVFAGGLDQTGSKVFAKVTSVTVTSITGNGAGDTLDLGYGDKIGVPVPAGATGLTIVKLVSNAVEEAASATDATNNSFTPTTATNGTNDYEVWYKYSHPMLAVLAQNQSDVAQKVIELVAQLGALVIDVDDIRTKVNAARSGVYNGEVLLVSGDDAAGTMAANGSALAGPALVWESEEGTITFQVRVKVSAITNVWFFLGLTDVLPSTTLEEPVSLAVATYTANATDCVGFMFDTAATTDTIRAVGVKAGTEATHVDTALAPVNDTYRDYKIVIDAAGDAKFYSKLTTTDTWTLVATVDDAVSPGVDLVPILAVCARAAASRTLTGDLWSAK